MNRIIKYISRIHCQLRHIQKRIKLGTNTYITISSNFEKYNAVGSDTVYNGSLGYASCIGNRCYLSADIGRYTSIGDNVVTLQYTHPTESFVSTHPAFYSTLCICGLTYTDCQKYNEERYIDVKRKIAVNIGNDVWIGSGVQIIGGLTIGDGAIIAAGAVVTKNVEPYSIVGGVPAKTIRYRFTDSQMDFLKELQWWNKPQCWIAKHSDYFDDIEKLIEAVKNENM